MTTLALDRRHAYADAFARECAQAYPVIDAIEQRCGHAIDRARLEHAASVLACPLKARPPNWQHGRVLYALTRQSLGAAAAHINVLDIGTAKGFSALCLRWAIDDAGFCGRVTSVDVIDPEGAAPRNTVAELNGPVTLGEILQSWPEAQRIAFLQSSGIEYLERHADRIHVAFVDGKHQGCVVRREGVLLAARQEAGDLAIFDDCHLPDVSQAVCTLEGFYKFEYVEVLRDRHYAIGVRR